MRTIASILRDVFVVGAIIFAAAIVYDTGTATIRAAYITQAGQ